MKLKSSLFLTALCAANLCASYAAPRATVTKTKAAKPSQVTPKVISVAAKSSTPTTSPTMAPVLINATTRNDTPSKVTLQLAQNGKALLPIVISAKASASTQAVAKEMAELLKRISGATFEVKTGDGTSGIVIGNQDEFPVPALESPQNSQRFRRQGSLRHSHA